MSHRVNVGGALALQFTIFDLTAAIASAYG